MPKFLSRAEFYRLLQRELPQDVYPDGEPDKFYSTADMDAIADCAATGYGNLEKIYNNYFPQDADERISAWEFIAFAKTLPASLTLQERRDRIVVKIRQRKGIRKQDMIDTVKGIIGSDKTVDLIGWGCSSGGWMIGVSQLGISTFLNMFPGRLGIVGSDICEKTAAELGITEQQLLDMKEEAYTYEIRIYGYTLTADEREEIDLALSEVEAARDNHVITDGLDPADTLDGEG